jgi:hypothetical protein
MRSILAGCAFAAACVSIFAGAAQAGPVALTNGNFAATTTPNGGSVPDGLCYAGGNTACVNVTGWTNTDGYTFISNNRDLGLGYYGNVTLYAVAPVPNGGDFIASDGNAVIGAKGTLSQAVNNLIVGDYYAVSFEQSAAQQNNRTGNTTDQWEVSLGGVTDYSQIMNNVSGSATPWEAQTLVFQATGTSELLSFLALGTPSGSPPFALLDGVSIAVVPEPSAVAMLGLGALGLVLFRRTRGPQV